MPFGIDNVKEEQLNFNYDKHYKKIGLMLKCAKTEEERIQIKQNSKSELNELLKNIIINYEQLKEEFISLLMDKDSSRYLWILYSKYENELNYIDVISEILKLENEVVRGGTNTYKMNGWMAHSLYVYQIVNYNIVNNIGLINFDNKIENIKQLKELNGIYNKLSFYSKFILRVFSLIHDIGVIEDIKFHDRLGGKYVEKVFKEIGINQDVLNKLDIFIDLKDFTKIIQELIKYHTLITSLSSESSDLFVENQYKELLYELPEINNLKEEVPMILFLLAYGDVIAVDESLMNIEKFKRIEDCYNFFIQIYKGKVKRNKEKVAIERICDMVGESKIQNLESKFDVILKNYNIDKKQFVDDMYKIKLMRYTGPLMKTLKDTQMTIKIYYELFELLGYFEGKDELANYTIIFVPDRHENDFVEQFKNGNFFECVKLMKKNNLNKITYKNINIEKGINLDGKYLHIRVVE